MRGCGCHDTSLERETGIRPRTVDAVFCRCHLALPCHESVAACICLEDSKATTLAALAEVVDGKPGCRSFRSSPARRGKKKRHRFTPSLWSLYGGRSATAGTAKKGSL